MSEVEPTPVAPTPPASNPRSRPPAPPLGELVLLGLAGPLVGHGAALACLLFLAPTPGAPDHLFGVILALLGALLAETILGPGVVGYLALRRERGRGGPGSRRTFMEGALAGFLWICATAYGLHRMGSIG